MYVTIEYSYMYNIIPYIKDQVADTKKYISLVYQKAAHRLTAVRAVHQQTALRDKPPNATYILEDKHTKGQTY